MSKKTGIAWTDATWNALTGCSPVSEACRYCYAARQAAGRLAHLPQYQGLAEMRAGRPVFTGEIRLLPERLTLPLRWTQPRRVFVNSMSDLFHENVPTEYIDRVFAVMGLAERHTFQVLTKRPRRMHTYLNDPAARERIDTVANQILRDTGTRDQRARAVAAGVYGTFVLPDWPLENVWLGTSIEDQKTARERIMDLVFTPAGTRFLSAEPLLGPIDLYAAMFNARWDPQAHEPVDLHGMNDIRFVDGQGSGIDWVIVGGESGPKARPMHPDWARSLRDQCAYGNVPFFFKQWGEWAPPSIPRRNTAGREDIALRDLERVGVKAAGNQLDGRTHEQYPWQAGDPWFDLDNAKRD